jgi:probable rRNA maturation factor
LDNPDGELSILLVDDEQISELNSTYLQRKGPTNVIAFPMRSGDFSDINPLLLGDVVISVETAGREGEAIGISGAERLVQLLVHGVLHLLGYDHETTESEALRMEEKSQELLRILTTNSGPGK